MSEGAGLDAAVADAWRELRERRVPAPRALLFLATGAGRLGDHLEGAGSEQLGSIPGVPPPWREADLLHGSLGPLPVWIVDDVGVEAARADGRPAWAAGFPCWLAADAGASLCLHASAGSALDGSDAAEGDLGVARDHLNLSGGSPLVGIGESRLGPLFPDVSALHHVGLRRRALERAEALGRKAREVVVACVAGPALETAAERRMLARAGADVSVQGLAPPLLACAHAGLSALALVAVTGGGDGPIRLDRVLAASQRLAPALEDWILALAGDLEEAAR